MEDGDSKAFETVDELMRSLLSNENGHPIVFERRFTVKQWSWKTGQMAVPRAQKTCTGYTTWPDEMLRRHRPKRVPVKKKVSKHYAPFPRY